MIAWVLLFLLLLLSVRCFAWGLRDPEHLYQFPTLFGAAWLLYIVPQALGAVNNPTKFPSGVLEDWGIEMALLMCIACLQAGWYGYFRDEKSDHVKLDLNPPAEYSHSKLLQAGVILYVIGIYAAYLLASLTGGFLQQFTGGGHYELEWEGLPVRYVFFSQLIYPALLLVTLALMHAATFTRLTVFFLVSLYPLATTLLLGRRTMTAYLLIIIFMSIFFGRRWSPPRALVFCGFIAMALFVIIAPQYRTIAQHGLDLEKISAIEVSSSFKEIVSGKAYAEFDVLVVQTAAANREGLFGLGTNFYNSIISQLIPRQIVGESFKSSLMIDLWGESLDTVRLYSWEIPYGSAPTGIANAFTEFWFFGAIVFYFAAHAVRKVWDRAMNRSDLGAQVWYVVIALLVPISVIGSLYIIPGQLIIIYCFLTPLLWYSRQNRLFFQK